jgi:hypothetical protein
MQLGEIANFYRTKSDDELVQLASRPEQLTVEALAALKGELTTRRIEIPSIVNLREGESQNEHADSRTTSISPSLGAGALVADVVRLYRSQFSLFISLTAPAVLVSGAALLLVRWENEEIVRNAVNRSGHLPRSLEFVEMQVLVTGRYLLSWLALCYSFGAVSTATDQIARGCIPSALSCIAWMRRSLIGFSYLSLRLFVVFAVGIVSTTSGVTAAYFFLIRPKFAVNPIALQVVIISLACLFLLAFSRLGLAIPAFLLERCRVGQCLFRSDELTEGRWLALAALLAKWLVAGYVAVRAPFWLASLIPERIALPSWFAWVLTAMSVAGVTLVEPTLLIGLALLYVKLAAGSTREERAQSLA